MVITGKVNITECYACNSRSVKEAVAFILNHTHLSDILYSSHKTTYHDIKGYHMTLQPTSQKTYLLDLRSHLDGIEVKRKNTFKGPIKYFILYP